MGRQGLNFHFAGQSWESFSSGLSVLFCKIMRLIGNLIYSCVYSCVGSCSFSFASSYSCSCVHLNRYYGHVSFDMVLLMEEILDQLISSFPIIYRVLHPRWCRISSINSISIVSWSHIYSNPSFNHLCFLELCYAVFLLIVNLCIHSFIHWFLALSHSCIHLFLHQVPQHNTCVDHPHDRPCSSVHISLRLGSQSSWESHSDSFKMIGIIYFEIQYGRTMFVIHLWQLFHASREPANHMAMPCTTANIQVEVKPPPRRIQMDPIGNLQPNGEGQTFLHGWSTIKSSTNHWGRLPVMVVWTTFKMWHPQQKYDKYMKELEKKSLKSQSFLQGVRTGSTAIALYIMNWLLICYI